MYDYQGNEISAGGKIIPSGLTKYPYKGMDIEYNKNHKFAIDTIKTLSASYQFQGGACFGDLLFMFCKWEVGHYCWIYDLTTGNLVQQVTIASADQGFVTNCHCNSVNFGTRYYDDGDDFPLLYVSTGYGDGTNTGCLVYRITSTTSGSTTTYSLTLVQTIKTPFSSWTEVVPGDDNDIYVTNSSNGVYYRIYRFAMPTTDATLDIDDVLQTYEFTPQPSNMTSLQGFMYTNGCFLSPEGLGGTDEGFLICWDLESCTRTIIDIKSAGVTEEPEAFFVWDGQLCLVCKGTKIYSLYFE